MKTSFLEERGFKPDARFRFFQIFECWELVSNVILCVSLYDLVITVSMWRKPYVVWLINRLECVEDMVYREGFISWSASGSVDFFVIRKFRGTLKRFSFLFWNCRNCGDDRLRRRLSITYSKYSVAGDVRLPSGSGSDWLWVSMLTHWAEFHGLSHDCQGLPVKATRR